MEHAYLSASAGISDESGGGQVVGRHRMVVIVSAVSRDDVK